MSLLVEQFRHPLQFLDGFSAFKLHQLMAVSGFHPADAEIRHEEADHVTFTKVGDE